jgi:conjugal transfer mating pair stabilization protein TraG
MEFQIITFGNGEILKGVLDAIAMCLNSQTGTLYTPLIRIGLIFAVLWAAIYSIWGNYLKAWGQATIPFILIPPLLFVPSTRVWVHDVVSGYHQPVDHVPYGLAYVTHFISKIGYEVTRQVDRVFADVEDLKYHKSGFLMASNLIIQAKTFRISNEDVASNMREFVCQCVAYEAMLGYKYTFEDLRHSADIWELVSARPSKIRSFIWKHPHKQDEVASPPEIISCADGVKRFNLLWKDELDRTTTVLGLKLFGHANSQTARKELLKYLPLSYGFLSGLSQSADHILKQQMMIHALVDGIEQKSTSMGNAPNFAARRAYLQQRSTYETLGAMASESLMTMKGVLEAIAYAFFIFLVPLAILPFGVRILLSWVQILLWLQMWSPLYAVLNYMMSMGAKVKSLGMLSTSNPEGVTIASSVGLMNLNADISAMAGYLAMSIPFLAIALVKGVGSFVHLASHLGNVSQGAAAQAAGDAITGNYSFGNISEGNQQIANTSMLNASHAASYRANAFQFVDGRTDISTMSDGTQMVNIGTSNVPISPNAVETQSSQQSEMATQSYQKGLSQSESSAKHLGDSYRQLVDLSNHLAQSESLSDGANKGVSAEQSKAIHKAAQLISGVDHDNQLNTDKSATLSGNIGVGTGKGGGIVSGSLGLQGTISASDQDILRSVEKFSTDENFQKAYRDAVQASVNVSHNVSNETAKRLSDGVAGSFEQSMSERAEAAKSFQESNAWSQQAMNTRTNAAAINANYNQQFVEWLAERPADNAQGKIGYRGAANIIATHPQEAIAWGNQFMKDMGLTPSISLSTNPNQLKTDYHNETGHQVYRATKDSLESVRQQGASELPSAATIQQKGEELVREETASFINTNNDFIDTSSSQVSGQGSQMQKKVKSQQGRYVTGRALEKVGQETKDTLKDMFDMNGEPQQK